MFDPNTLHDDPTVLVYARVSTADQKLPRQLLSALPYTERMLGADLGGADVDDVAEHVEAVGGGQAVEVGDVTIYHDKSTGTNTNRDGYRAMMDRVKTDDVTAVAFHDTTRLGRSLQDIDATVKTLTDNGAQVHFVREGLPPFKPDEQDPMGTLMLQMLGAFAEWEVRTKRMNTREGIAARHQSDDDYHHGRPPIGFQKESGHLYEQQSGPQAFDRVATVLDMVAAGEMSKRKAAGELNTSRATIGNAIDDRGELYGL